MGAGEHLDQARLACAVVAEDAGHLAGVDVHRDLLQRHDIPVVLRDGVGLEEMRPAHRDLALVARERKAAFIRTAATRIPPRTVYVQFESQPDGLRPMLATPRIAAPKLAPTTDP